MVNIEDVLKRLGIVARKTGREWTARCPNKDHDDRHPSWRIRDDGSDRHGLHQCHPCSFGGSVVDLVMHVQRIGYKEALAWLGGDATSNQPVPEFVAVESTRYRRFRVPTSVCLDPFEKWQTKPPGQYLLDREVTERQVVRWGLGYAIDGRIGGRIFIPYKGAAGDTRSYNARTYRNAVPKYMQPDEKEHADRCALFGEQYWPDFQWREVVFVCEGELNALAVERAMGEEAAIAAVSGSQFLPIHAAKLRTFKNVMVLSDPDAAGDKLYATLEKGLLRHVNSWRVTLATGTDANSISREELRSAILKRMYRAGLPGEQ